MPRRHAQIRPLLLLCVTLGLLSGCGGTTESELTSPAAIEAVETAAIFTHAESLSAQGDLAGAFAALQRSLQAGYPSPSDVLSSAGFGPLLDDAEWRPKLYDLLRENARESDITMVSPDAAGEPMVLTVRVVAGQSDPPVPVEPAFSREGVIVGLVHVNDAGYYNPTDRDASWNPRLFGFAVTDGSGTIVVRTIRPGYYAPEHDSMAEPAHAHYTIEYNGNPLRASEFFFSDDPRLTEATRREAERMRVPIASVTRGADGVWQAEVSIPVLGLR